MTTINGMVAILSMGEDVHANTDILQRHGLADFTPRNGNKARLRRAVIAVKEQLRQAFIAQGMKVKFPDHHRTESDTYELSVPTIELTPTGRKMKYISAVIVSVDEHGHLAFRPANVGDSLDNNLVEAIKREYIAAAGFLDSEQVRVLIRNFMTTSHLGCRAVSLMSHSGGAPYFIPDTRATQLEQINKFMIELNAINNDSITWEIMPLDGSNPGCAGWASRIERNSCEMIQKEIDAFRAELQAIQNGTSCRNLRGRAKEAQEIKEKIASYGAVLKAREAEFVEWANKATTLLDREVDTYEKNRPLSGSEWLELMGAAASPAPAPVAPVVNNVVANTPVEVSAEATPEVNNVVAAAPVEVAQEAPVEVAPLPAAEFAPTPVVEKIPILVNEPAPAPEVDKKKSRFELMLEGK